MFGKTSRSHNELYGDADAVAGPSASSGTADAPRKTEPVVSVPVADRTADVRLSHGAPINGASTASPARSIISADLKVVGDLHCDGDLQIDGTVEGDINSRMLTVGEGAHIEGSITAQTARIWGFASGQVNAASVTIAKTAKVTGDIAYQTLAIEEGAVLDGQCRRAASAKSAGGDTDVTALKPGQSAKVSKGNSNAGGKSVSGGDNPVAA